MKQKYNLYSLLLILLYLVVFSAASARPLTTKQVADKQLNYHISREGSLPKFEDSHYLEKLMGSEHCENGDEECLNRRLVSEAHLDYIYTQHHRP